MNGKMQKPVDAVKEAVTNEWQYKVALAVITVLAFATRFYGISHPNQVVFDEVHFGKVSLSSRLVSEGEAYWADSSVVSKVALLC